MCQIDPNPDVTGTGIRASIYTLCLAASVLKTLIIFFADETERNKELRLRLNKFARVLDSALQVQGLALLFTAIYETFHQQLTLFHAICVLHLLSLLGFGLTASEKYGQKGRIGWLVLQAARVLVAGAFLAFAGYIWINAPRFGSQPACNKTTVYVVFFVSIDATNIVIRYVITALMITAVIGVVIQAGVFALVAACFWGVKRSTQAMQSDGSAVLKTVIARAQPKGDRNKCHRLQRMFGDGVLRTLVNVYGIVMLELTVHRNNLNPAERPWTFGQVLALFMLLSVAIEVFNMVLTKIDSKQDSIADEENAGHPANSDGEIGGEVETEMADLSPHEGNAALEDRPSNLETASEES